MTAVSYDANPDWVDSVIVEQVLAGRRPARPLTDAEKTAVVRELARRGWSTSGISEATGMRRSRVRQVLGEVAG